jgi:transcriptional regulator GlxA family with amidase domain
VLSFAALSVFEFANKEMGDPVYHVRLLSEAGGSIRSSIGVSVATEPLDDTNFDTLIVGGSAVIGSLTPGVIKFLRQALARYWRVAATCIGAFILAEQLCSTSGARPRTGARSTDPQWRSSAA